MTQLTLEQLLTVERYAGIEYNSTGTPRKSRRNCEENQRIPESHCHWLAQLRYNRLIKPKLSESTASEHLRGLIMLLTIDRELGDPNN